MKAYCSGIRCKSAGFSSALHLRREDAPFVTFLRVHQLMRKSLTTLCTIIVLTRCSKSSIPSFPLETTACSSSSSPANPDLSDHIPSQSRQGTRRTRLATPEGRWMLLNASRHQCCRHSVSSLGQISFPSNLDAIDVALSKRGALHKKS